MKFYFKLAFFSLLFFNLTHLNAQNFITDLLKKIIDEKSGKPMLVGYCTKDNILNDTSFAWWFEAEYDYYQPEDSVLKLINLDSVKIVCVAATWCGDTRRELPRFYKILDALKFDFSNYIMFCVDRKKKAEGFDIDQYIIERVPTFIFYKNDSEIGRIIETPVETLERDILKILQNSE